MFFDILEKHALYARTFHKGYKSLRNYAIAGIFPKNPLWQICLIFLGVSIAPGAAGTAWGLEKSAPEKSKTSGQEIKRYDRELAGSVLLQVEKLSENAETLDQLGKETLEQSAAILDMGESSLPLLLKMFRDKGKNWKMRYWATDILGYVGNRKTLPHLFKSVRDETEYQTIRLRALDSIMEISRKDGDTASVRRDLLKMLPRIKNKKVREKIKASAGMLTRIPQLNNGIRRKI